MAEYEASTYGERVAEEYERLMPPRVAAIAGAIVEFLASVARRPRALELGIGTGRIAVPLRERGFEVSGIDASPAMVKRLRAKKGGASIPVEMGDFGDLKVRGKFPLIYVVWNTFFALLTQDAQVRCFQRIARRLTSDGVFVMEAFVPDLASFHDGQRVKTNGVEVDAVNLEVTQQDQASQIVTSMHVVITERGTKLYPVRLRYAFPSELDLMALLAGMRLRERFGGWHREPFTSASPSHVSVYELSPAAGGATRWGAGGRRK